MQNPPAKPRTARFTYKGNGHTAKYYIFSQKHMDKYPGILYNG